MNTTELKTLAEDLHINHEYCPKEVILKAAAAILELIAAHEDAQGEIRALRATEQNLRERVKELEEALQSLASYPLEEFALESKPDNRQLFGANDWKLSVGNVKRARALLEQKP